MELPSALRQRWGGSLPRTVSACDSDALGQPVDEIHIALQEVILWQVFWMRPGNLCKVQIFGLARKLGYTEEHEASELSGAIAEIIALDFFTDLRVNSEFFPKLARQ